MTTRERTRRRCLRLLAAVDQLSAAWRDLRAMVDDAATVATNDGEHARLTATAEELVAQMTQAVAGTEGG